MARITALVKAIVRIQYEKGEEGFGLEFERGLEDRGLIVEPVLEAGSGYRIAYFENDGRRTFSYPIPLCLLTEDDSASLEDADKLDRLLEMIVKAKKTLLLAQLQEELSRLEEKGKNQTGTEIPAS